jgi:hypothetical protein
MHRSSSNLQRYIKRQPGHLGYRKGCTSVEHNEHDYLTIVVDTIGKSGYPEFSIVPGSQSTKSRCIFIE